jgi:hypothetical protein
MLENREAPSPTRVVREEWADAIWYGAEDFVLGDQEKRPERSLDANHSMMV